MLKKGFYTLAYGDFVYNVAKLKRHQKHRVYTLTLLPERYYDILPFKMLHFVHLHVIVFGFRWFDATPAKSGYLSLK